MSVTSTKKPQSAPARRTAADLPQWQAHLAAGEKLRDERRRLAVESAKIDGVHEPTPSESRIIRLTTAVWARVHGEPEPEPETDPATIGERAAAADAALQQHERRTRMLTIEVAGELWASDYEQEAFRLRGEWAAQPSR